MKAAARGLVLASTALFALLFAWRAHGFWVFTLDDAFITLRYAKHLAAALGPAWNPGAEPVEGYTTALWLLLLAAGQLLGLDGVLVAKVAGVLFAIAATLCASKLASVLCEGEDGRVRAAAAATPLVMAAAYWPWSLHAVSGMETTLAGLLLVLLFWWSVRVQSTPSATPGLAGALAFCALLATLTRPEFALACAVCLSLCFVQVPNDTRRSLGRALVCYALLPGLVYFGWRLWRYRLFLPLSFYVKSTGQPPLAGLDQVGQFFLSFVRDQPLWGVLVVLGSLGRRALLPALAGALSLVVFFLFPAHIMAFEGRYLMPLFPFLSALAGAGMAQVVQRVLRAADARGWGRSAFALIGGVMFALGLFSFPLPMEQRAAPWLAYGRGLKEAHIELGQALKRAGGTARGHSIALLDVGAVGYIADWFTIDTYGLNDPHVALTRRTDVSYVLDQRPEILVVVSSQREHYEPLFDWELPLYRAASAHGYEFVCSYRFDDEYYLWLLTRAKTLGQRVCSGSAAP